MLRRDFLKLSAVPLVAFLPLGTSAAKKGYLISGTDAHGNPVSEIINLDPLKYDIALAAEAPHRLWIVSPSNHFKAIREATDGKTRVHVDHGMANLDSWQVVFFRTREQLESFVANLA